MTCFFWYGMEWKIGRIHGHPDSEKTIIYIDTDIYINITLYTV